MALLVRTLAGDIVHEKPPDGGWSWVIMVASFFNVAIVFGISKGLGIFFIDWKDEFGVNNSQASLISSITLSLLGLGAPIATYIQRRIGARKLIMMSGVLCCFGMTISAFATNIIMVYVGIGVICGLGFSWSFAACLSQIGLYFDKWRPTANGITCAGSSVASTLLPFLSDYLLKTYGWRGTMFIFAGLGLNISLCGAFIRPISVIPTVKPDKKSEDDELTVFDDNGNTDVTERTSGVAVKISGNSRCMRVQHFFRTYWVLMLLGLGEFLTSMGLFVPIVFIVPFARESDCTASEAAFILSMVSIADIISRPLSGFLITWIPAFGRNLLRYISVCSFGIAIVQIIAATSQGFTSLVVYAVLYGVIYGLLTPASITAVPVLLGLKDIQKYMGLKFLAGGIASMIGSPLAGHLVDISGSYRVAYWYVMVTFSITGVLYFVVDVVVGRLGGVLPKHRTRETEESSGQGVGED